MGNNFSKPFDTKEEEFEEYRESLLECPNRKLGRIGFRFRAKKTSVRNFWYSTYGNYEKVFSCTKYWSFIPTVVNEAEGERVKIPKICPRGLCMTGHDHDL